MLAPDVIGYALAFTPDGRVLASGGLGDRFVHLWDVEKGRLLRELEQNVGGVHSLEFSLDGRTLAVGGYGEPYAALLDVATGAQLGPRLTAGRDAAMVDVSPDGRSLLQTHGSGEGAVWDIDPESWERRACALANRTLTQEEWKEFLPGRPYEPACGAETGSGADRPGEACQRGRRREAAGTETPPHEQRRRSGLSGEPEAGCAETLAVPPRRQPDDEQAGVAARLQHALLARRSQQRLGRDAQDPLNGERTVREQAARVAPAMLRHCRGTCEPERHIGGTREPRAELDRRPVVLGPAERDEHGALGRRVPRNEQRHVAGRLLEEGSQLLVGSSLGQELVGGVGEQEIDVELGGEPSQLRTGRRRRERGRTGYDTARFECRPALFEPGRRGPKLGCVRHEPGQDQDARRVSHKRLGHREQRVDVCLVRDRDENRPLRDLAGHRRALCAATSSEGSCRRIARSSSWSAGLGSIPSSSTRARRASW